MVSQALPNTENQNNADLIPVATVLSSKNPRKGPRNHLFKLLATVSSV